MPIRTAGHRTIRATKKLIEDGVLFCVQQQYRLYLSDGPAILGSHSLPHHEKTKSDPLFQTFGIKSQRKLTIANAVTLLFLGSHVISSAGFHATTATKVKVNPLNPELNPICYLLALLEAHHFLHVSRIRVKSLTFRRLMSYIYGAPILDVSRSHTTTQHSR